MDTSCQETGYSHVTIPTTLHGYPVGINSVVYVFPPGTSTNRDDVRGTV